MNVGFLFLRLCGHIAFTGGGSEDTLCSTFCEFDELFVFRDEVGFAEDFHHDSFLAITCDTDHTFFGSAVLPVFRFCNTGFAEVASPYIGYAVSKQAGTSWDDMNRFSYGAGLGAGVQLWCFQLTAQYNWNLGALENVRNTSLENFDKSKINGASVSLALMFGKRK